MNSLSIFCSAGCFLSAYSLSALQLRIHYFLAQKYSIPINPYRGGSYKAHVRISNKKSLSCGLSPARLHGNMLLTNIIYAVIRPLFISYPIQRVILPFVYSRFKALPIACAGSMGFLSALGASNILQSQGKSRATGEKQWTKQHYSFNNSS